MNTDYLIPNGNIRELDLTERLDSSNVSCNKVRKYANDQNTIYDSVTNQILYGVNKNMHALGVADGTCNLINPLVFTPNHICGAGAAGGNPCVPDAYGIKNTMSTDNGNKYGRETFNSQQDYLFTPNVLFILIIIFFIIVVIKRREFD